MFIEVSTVDTPPGPGPGQIHAKVTGLPLHPGDLQAVSAGHPSPGEPVVAGRAGHTMSLASRARETHYLATHLAVPSKGHLI